MTQRLSVERQDTAGDCQINVPGFHLHNALHMRNLVLRLQDELEWHRNYAANQVCDGIIDFLGMLFYEFAHVKSRFPNERDLQAHLSLILDLVGAVISQISGMRGEFRPAVLDKSGLVKVIESEISRVCEKADIESQIYITDRNLNFNKDFEVALFRVVEQVLSNIEKRSNASEVVFAYGVSDCNTFLYMTFAFYTRYKGIGLVFYRR